MSEEQEHPYTDEQLHEALSRLAGKTGEAACPFCGTRLWGYESSAPGTVGATPKVAHIPMTNRAFFGPAPSIPGITLTCMECGFVRLHSLPALLKERPDAN